MRLFLQPTTSPRLCHRIEPCFSLSAQPHFIFPAISTTEVLPVAWHYVASPKPKMGNSTARRWCRSLSHPTLWRHRSTATLALFSLSCSQRLRPAGAHATTLYKTTSWTISSDRKSTRVFPNQPSGLRQDEPRHTPRSSQAEISLSYPLRGRFVTKEQTKSVSVS